MRQVQIDFSVAFDRINQQGILYKLYSVGIGGSAHCALMCRSAHSALMCRLAHSSLMCRSAHSALMCEANAAHQR